MMRTANPILKDEQVIVDNSLAGTWVEKENDGQLTLVVQPAGQDKKYPAVFTDKDGKKSSLIGRLGKVGDVEVIEFTVDPAQLDAMGDYAKGLLMPLYSPAIIHPIDANHLTAEMMDPDWLKKYAAGHPDDLSILKVNGDENNEVVTASTEDFQKFLLKHLKDDGAMKPTTWQRSAAATQPATAPARPGG
jgi:hypothetical protein